MVYQLLTLSCFVAIHFVVGAVMLSKDSDQLPFVTSRAENEERKDRELLIVSTIDGKISAFKSANGQMMWSISTEPGDLLSSSLTELEVMFRGQRIRLVPSLDGNLYKFDGKMLEPLPVSAEMLLSTSYKIGDNLNIVGGRDIRSYGINLHTGELRYLCTSEGCKQFSVVSESEDILIVERRSQTVRAVNSRNGDDQWSYSVGEHRVTLSKGLKFGIPPPGNIVNVKQNEMLVSHPDDESILIPSVVKVAMMKGFIGAVDHSTNHYKWSQKLSSPIVDVWQLQEDSVVALDLFERAGFVEGSVQMPSLLVVGVYDKKLYIKQSGQKGIDPSVAFGIRSYPGTLTNWMPVLPEESTSDIADTDPTSLMLKYPDYSYENGIFFYESNPKLSNTTHCYAQNKSKFSSVNQSVLSFLYKWKELIFISTVFSVISNIFVYFLCKRYQKRSSFQHQVVLVQQKDANKSGNHAAGFVKVQRGNSFEVAEHPSQQCKKDISGNSPGLSKTPFQSRYLSDFELIECLGKGGYGVVYEVKNKIDCCSYAVKRIKFSKEHAFDRVIREVKVLAKLDHRGIVRYYNAWVETPPAALQDAYNKECDNLMSSSIYSGASHAYSSSRQQSTNPLKPFDDELLSDSIDELQVNGKNSSSSSSVQVVFKNSGSGSALSVGQCNYGNSGDNSVVFKDISKADEIDTPKESTVKPTKYLYIQMQLCRKESLKDWLNSNCHERDRVEVLDIFYQIVSAVEYVHEQGLMHRDLKPSNIFFSLDGVVKIGDFGLVSSEHDDDNTLEDVQCASTRKSFLKHTDEVGTKLYMSPEMVHRLDYNHKVDIFSLGLIFYELLVPFRTQYERIKILTEIKTGRFPKSFRINFKDECEMAALLLEEKPDKRPSAAEIKDDPIFNVIRSRDMNKQMKPRTVSTASKRSSTEDSNEL